MQLERQLIESLDDEEKLLAKRLPQVTKRWMIKVKWEELHKALDEKLSFDSQL